MKKRALLFLVFTIPFLLFSQEESFKKGEWLKYRVHYEFVNVGYATLTVDQTNKEGQDLYHVVGEGWTKGVASWFFKVEDTYESYFDKETGFPTHFVRRVNEGGYIINRDIYFDQEKETALVEDHKQNTKDTLPINQVHDMISTLYQLRNKNLENLKEGDSLSLKMFFDSKTFPFKLIYLGRETIKSKYGKIACYKMRPLVQSGRVFKENESVTFWVSADKNKIPIRIKGSLAVGSIKVDLDDYRGLSHSFSVL